MEPLVPSIYSRALEGTLTAAELDANSDLNYIHPKSKLTPLGAAVWNGHVKQVKLLLEKGAYPNGTINARPPLWVAASRTKANAGRIVQILLSRGADASRKSRVDNGSTPLLGAVKTYKSSALISALVDAGGLPDKKNKNGESADSVATMRKDRARLQAMVPRSQRQSNRLPTLLMLSGLMLGIVAWANEYKNVKTAAAVTAALTGVGVAANAIKKQFGWSGWFDSPWFPKHLQEPKMVDQFKADVRNYIEESHLDRFFPPDDEFLERVAESAVELEENSENTLDVPDLCRLSLYQPYIYCDDSTSMNKEHRNEHQTELVRRIASITTRLVPDETGIELRFINRATSAEMTKPSLDTINEIMENSLPEGMTEIGTNLKSKILSEAVYDTLESEGLKRPVLVSIITDGVPRGRQNTPERMDTLKNVILECGQILKGKGYNKTDVRFQISQIGSDSKAKKFLRSLGSDPRLEEVLYCTTDRLDDEFDKYRDNDARLERWLLELLMGPIINAASA